MVTISDRPCRFVGVDLHKQTITIAVVGGDRKLISRKRFSNLQSDAIVAYLKTHAPLELVVEAGGPRHRFGCLGDEGTRCWE